MTKSGKSSLTLIPLASLAVQNMYARQMLIVGASYVLSDEEDLALCMDFL